jgi:hypothetical protein
LSLCDHEDRERLQGACYSCCKAAAGLLCDLPANGQGPPTDGQRRWVGLEDPDVSGRWDYSSVPVTAPDLLSWLLAREPITGLDRRVPEHWDRPLKGWR